MKLFAITGRKWQNSSIGWIEILTGSSRSRSSWVRRLRWSASSGPWTSTGTEPSPRRWGKKGIEEWWGMRMFSIFLAQAAIILILQYQWKYWVFHPGRQTPSLLLAWSAYILNLNIFLFLCSPRNIKWFEVRHLLFDFSMLNGEIRKVHSVQSSLIFLQ